MQFVEGRIFVDQNLLGLRPDERDQVYSEMVRVLAKLHTIDFNAIALGKYGK